MAACSAMTMKTATLTAISAFRAGESGPGPNENDEVSRDG